MSYAASFILEVYSAKYLEMFYLNTIEQLFLFIEQLDQLEVCHLIVDF